MRKKKQKLSFLADPAEKFRLTQQLYPDSEIQVRETDRESARAEWITTKIARFLDYREFLQWLRAQFDDSVTSVEWRVVDFTHAMVARDTAQLQ